MSRFNALRKGKCPKCETGKVFITNGNILKLKGPVMHDNCPHCNYKFEREPGYFYGAMFMSYGITMAEALATFVIIQIFNLDLSVDGIMAVIIAVILIFIFPNYKLSRILWMYIFTKKEETDPADKIERLKI
ncbi:hypothetical protein [Roseivirga sp.]|uniref:hypothetical protein n=1 Tax=Roseivirga sp. TaxID=1964215 RepID=UPI002B275952|nr:hypothetical protein [Roseivirga sp.]